MCMTPHGPDTDTFEAAITADLVPAHLPKDTLAFMFEVHYTPRVMPGAMALPQIDRDYYKCWSGLKSHFVHPAVKAAASNGKPLVASKTHGERNGELATQNGSVDLL
jgi:homogentisate 1,2-dioxygenase